MTTPKRIENDDKDNDDDLGLEATLLSAHSLAIPSSFFLFPARRLRPFVVLSSPVNRSTYRTRVDETGGNEPKWDDTVTVPVGQEFLRARIRPDGPEYGSARVRVRVMSKRLIGGPVELGWCDISADDVADGLRPPSRRRRLSYALRSPSHGCAGRGVVELAVRLVGRAVDRRADRLRGAAPRLEAGWRHVVVGIPVAASPEELVAAAAAAAPAPAWGCDDVDGVDCGACGS